jgi:hypothetical protein
VHLVGFLIRNIPSVIRMDSKFSDSESVSVTSQALIVCSTAEFILVNILDSLKLCRS